MGELGMHDTRVCPCFPFCNPRIVGAELYVCFVAILAVAALDAEVGNG